MRLKNNRAYRISVLKIILLSSFIFFSCSKKEEKIERNIKANDSIKVNHNEFGLLVDSLITFENKVDKNQTLSNILNSHNISYSQIYKITEAIRDSFNVRNIREGGRYIIYSKVDSSEHPYYLVYQSDPINYSVINLRDSIYAFNAKKKVTIIEKLVKGKIECSLYEALAKQNASPLLAIALSEVYAWQIDFFRIQKGDNFNIVYQEKYVDREFVGIGKILAARFHHYDNDYFAYGFSDDSGFNFYDETGKSLRKAFLKTPLKFSRISSRFSYSRLHPILKKRRPHLGIDFAAPKGTPVKAVGDGIIKEVCYKGQAGKFIKIRHNSVYQSGYLHLLKYAKGIKPGVKVRQGQIIGYVGSTGLSTGPHLDFRFWKNGKLVNYLSQKFPAVSPLSEDSIKEFNNIKNMYLSKINTNTFATIEKFSKLKSSKDILN